jgi:Na+/proline symporter
LSHNIGSAEIIFFFTLAATFLAALLARRHSNYQGDDGLAGRHFNRWLVGLSVGTTANSGFIVTAAVGLGYAYGLQGVLLPISWLLGDLVFWHFFPARINAFGHVSRATTLSEMLISGLSGPLTSAVSVLTALIIVVCLSGYTSAQWLAGQKFVSGAFGLSDYTALGLFAVTIIAYSSIGGFRGSVYTDTLQAFIRVAGTVIALMAVAWFAAADPAAFSRNIGDAGKDFMNPFPKGTVASVAGFICGFAAAAIGFGLGQPQIISRYLAGHSPEETRSARWIYISFVQFTWIAMTVFGILLRGVMPGISDPEAGLSIFFKNNLNEVATGIIAADIFATIASTSNGLLIAMAQAVAHDLIPRLSTKHGRHISLAAITLMIGIVTMGVSAVIQGRVLTLALSSVSLMGAGLAAAVMVKIMGWNHTTSSLACALSVGLVSAIAWKYSGIATYFNEAGIGMMSGLAANWLLAGRRRASSLEGQQSKGITYVG